MISGHTIPHHRYIDDSWLYVSFASGESAATLNALQLFLASAQSWIGTKSWGVMFDQNFTCSSHISVVCRSCLYHIWDLQLIHHYLDLKNHLQNDLQMRWCLVTLITAIPFCLVLQTMTSPNFNVFRIDWPMLLQSHHRLLAVFHCCVPYIGYQ